VDVNLVSPGYFGTLRIPVLAGRDFDRHDTPSSSRVVIINETLAQRFWPDKEALGQRLYIKDWRRPWTAEVVGIVADTKHRTLGELKRSILYWPYSQETFQAARLLLVCSNKSRRALSLIRYVAQELDKELAVTGSVEAADSEERKGKGRDNLETLTSLSQVRSRSRSGVTLFLRPTEASAARRDGVNPTQSHDTLGGLGCERTS
jgi:hypothetical protein